MSDRRQMFPTPYKVRPMSGAWACGCEDTDGTVTKIRILDGWNGPELHGFVGTPCGWSWIPLAGLKVIPDDE